MEVIFSQQAELDLEEIADTIAILFRPGASYLLLVRILHGSRDLPSLFSIDQV